MLPLRDNIPTTRVPYVTYGLIIANVLVYFFWQRGGIAFGSPENAHYTCQLSEWAAVPYDLTHPSTTPQLPPGCGPDDAPTYLTPFTAMFMHGGLLHLGGNMLFLWIFGNNLEDAMGRPRYLIFYVLGGLAAIALHVATGPGSETPTLGASGAIAAVLGGYAVLFPRARVVTVIFIVFFFTILELPALLVLGAWFLIQVMSANIGSAGGVAYFAHIGGFVFGLLAVRAFSSRSRVDSQLSRMSLPSR